MGVHPVCLVIFLILVSTLAANYRGYHVIRAIPRDTSALGRLVAFLQEEDNFETPPDVWSLPKEPNKYVTFSVSHTDVPTHTEWLEEAQIEYDFLSEDLQSLVDLEATLEASARSRSAPKVGGLDLNQFNSHDQINNFLEEMVAICDVCSTKSIGESYEGRNMLLIKIGSHRPGIRKYNIWIDAGIHAREWLAPATAINLIHKLVDGHNNGDPEVAWLLDHFVWFILPSANPDGYEYSRQDDRMWRKTRSDNPQTSCQGTDPNRNWRFHWGGTGTSANPCSEIYKGPRPFSEVETQNIMKFILKRRNHFLVYLSLHTYGQYWLYPWGFNSSLPEDWEEIHRVGQRAVSKIEETSGKLYTLGSSTNVLYAAAGASDDWAKGSAKIKYSYTVELRDEGYHGFLVPPSTIAPTAREIWAAIVEMSYAVQEYVDDMESY